MSDEIAAAKQTQIRSACLAISRLASQSDFKMTSFPILTSLCGCFLLYLILGAKHTARSTPLPSEQEHPMFHCCRSQQHLLSKKYPLSGICIRNGMGGALIFRFAPRGRWCYFGEVQSSIIMAGIQPKGVQEVCPGLHGIPQLCMAGTSDDKSVSREPLLLQDGLNGVQCCLQLARAKED